MSAPLTGNVVRRLSSAALSRYPACVSALRTESTKAWGSALRGGPSPPSRPSGLLSTVSASARRMLGPLSGCAVPEGAAGTGGAACATATPGLEVDRSNTSVARP